VTKVSVVIPTFEPKEAFRHALDSVHSQTYQDWELIVVDDGSQCDLSWLEREFPRVRLLRQKHLGVSVARNNGILNATGELISFLDHDDVWLPTKLETQVGVMSKYSQIGFSYTQLAKIDSAGVLLPGESVQAPSDRPRADTACTLYLGEPGEDSDVSSVHRSLLHFRSRFCTPSTVMIRRSALSECGLLEPLLPFTGDYDLLIRLGSRFQVADIHSTEVLYRVHEQNFSKHYEVCQKEIEELIRRYEFRARLNGDIRLLRSAKSLFRLPDRSYAAHAYDRCRTSLRDKKLREFAFHLAKAVQFDPGFVMQSLVLFGKHRLDLNKAKLETR